MLKIMNWNKKYFASYSNVVNTENDLNAQLFNSTDLF